MKMRRSRTTERGASQVEFVLSFTVVVFIVFWMFEFIMLFYTYSTLTDGAKEGVRYAIVHGSNNPTTVSAIQNRVKDFTSMSLHDTSGMTISVQYFKDDTNNTQYTDPGGGALTSTSIIAPPARVSVTVSYPYVPYLNLPWTTPTINATAQGRVAN